MEDQTHKPAAGLWHDWVGELFEPIYGQTIEDLVAHEEDHSNKPKIKHISVHDPEAIRQVYQKVHMMTKLEEEIRLEKQLQGLREKHRETGSVPVLGPSDIENILVPTGIVKTPDSERNNLEQSCIWDNGEIAVLREAYRSLKNQSIEATVYARETEKRNKELEALVAEQKKVIKSQQEQLTVSKNANRRLKINVDSLNEEVKYLTAKVGAMEEVIREIKQERTDMIEELHENRVTTDRERMAREKIQMKLDSLKREALAEKLAAEDKIRSLCRKAIHDLKEKVKSLEKQLLKEQTQRKVTEKGLDHLRKHFASLDVQEILPASVVDQDQLKHIQY